jgi:hypothetical protein
MKALQLGAITIPIHTYTYTYTYHPCMHLSILIHIPPLHAFEYFDKILCSLM